MKHKFINGLAGLALCWASATSANTVHDIAWQLGDYEDIEATWCTGATIKPKECHRVVCFNNKLYFSIFLEPIAYAPKPEPFVLSVDGKQVHHGGLKINFQHGKKLDLVSVKPLPATVVQAMIAGSEIQVSRLGEITSNTLRGSGKTIGEVRRLCQPPAANKLRSAKLDGLCQPHARLINFVGGYTTENIISERFNFINRYGTRNSTFDSGVRTFKNFGNRFEVSILYHGASNKRLGFQFFVPSGTTKLPPKVQADLTKIRDLALKFFEWRDIAIENNVRKFSKQFPDNLRPSIHDRLNFNFTVTPNNKGKLFYGLHSIHAHGLCWVYQQAIGLENTMSAARNAMASKRLQAARKKQGEQNLKQKFQ